jgi:hypothetical protein
MSDKKQVAKDLDAKAIELGTELGNVYVSVDTMYQQNLPDDLSKSNVVELIVFSQRCMDLSKLASDLSSVLAEFNLMVAKEDYDRMQQLLGKK